MFGTGARVTECPANADKCSWGKLILNSFCMSG